MRFPKSGYPSPFKVPLSLIQIFFCCTAQRAHANFGENIISFLPALAIAGLSYPVASAALGATWIVGRILYVLGYTRSGPKGRGV